jgi:hypothetical protein
VHLRESKQFHGLVFYGQRFQEDLVQKLMLDQLKKLKANYFKLTVLLFQLLYLQQEHMYFH